MTNDPVFYIALAIGVTVGNAIGYFVVRKRNWVEALMFGGLCGSVCLLLSGLLLFFS
jgi:hypothetical protein